VKNIQIVDGADNCTFSIFQATDAEFALLFPAEEQDIQFAEDLDEGCTSALEAIWKRPIEKRDAMGLHGTLFYEFGHRRKHFPASKRERDWNPLSLNAAQRELYRRGA